MENLTHTVYECSLPVEAHMICDLLGRAGISARVDGEFLAGAGGELPMGSNIKVRVDPSRAAEARAVIKDWESTQLPPEPSVPPRKPRSHSPLWFLCGMAVGGALIFLALRVPESRAAADFDGDNVIDEYYYYRGPVLSRVDSDRNADGKIDMRWYFDLDGFPERSESDDDFDGRFEWLGATEGGKLIESTLDANGDGKPEQLIHYRHGIIRTAEIFRDGRVLVRETHNSERLLSRETDSDGDGVFERRVNFDAVGEPIPQ
jgi:hypothetical protein